MSGGPLGDDQRPAARARHEMTDGIDDETNWGTNPVVFGAPVLCQGVDPTTSGRGKLRVKPRELCIVIGCKAVECMRTPFSIKEAEN